MGHEYYEKRRRAGRGSHSLADRAAPFVRRVDAGLVGRPKASCLCDLPRKERIECLLPLANVLASLYEVGFIGGLTSISRAILQALFIQSGP